MVLDFAHKDDLMQPSDGRPEIIIYNSSDRSSALKCFAGYFRGICSNGLVAGDGFQSKVYHNIKNIMSFEDQLRDMVARLPEMLGLVDKMKGTLIDGQTGLEIAESGASLRWANWEQEQFRAWKAKKGGDNIPAFFISDLQAHRCAVVRNVELDDPAE